MQINVEKATTVSLVVGQAYYETTLENIIIDDFDKYYKIPNFINAI